MTWVIEFLPEADRDLGELDSSVRTIVLKGIEKVRKNPLPQSEGGYGKPLGNHSSSSLANLLKIKFKNIGIRVVYKIVRDDDVMKVIIISTRDDEKVYREAERRRRKYNLCGCASEK